jgi:hypothetical protein
MIYTNKAIHILAVVVGVLVIPATGRAQAAQVAAARPRPVAPPHVVATAPASMAGKQRRVPGPLATIGGKAILPAPRRSPGGTATISGNSWSRRR